MRIVIIWPILNCEAVASVGLASIATQLEKSGHKVKIIIINKELGLPLDLEKIYSQCHLFSADIIGFSSVNSQYSVVIKIADFLKAKMNLPIVYGGPCPTITPEKCIENKSIDFVCVGEGEEALLELLKKISLRQDCSKIKNIWTKKSGHIVSNPTRPLTDLSILYPLNFSVFDNMSEILKRRNGWFDFSIMRGCPFNCSYCQNSFVHKLYGEKHGMRFAPIGKVIKNLADIIRKYKNIKYFNFNDDLFTINKRYYTAPR